MYIQTNFLRVIVIYICVRYWLLIWLVARLESWRAGQVLRAGASGAAEAHADVPPLERARQLPIRSKEEEEEEGQVSVGIGRKRKCKRNRNRGKQPRHIDRTEQR